MNKREQFCIKDSHQGGKFIYSWKNGRRIAFIKDHIHSSENKESEKGNSKPHTDTSRRIYQVKQSFFQQNGIELKPQSTTIEFMKKQYSNFSFQSNYKVLYKGSSNSKIKLIDSHQFCPSRSLYQAMGAARIINIIKANKYKEIHKNIEQFWSDDKKQMSNLSRQSAEMAIKLFRGMFSFQNALKDCGYHLNSQVFSQQRLKQGSQSQGWIVYNLTQTTYQIFSKSDIDQISRPQIFWKKTYIYGQGGIGKSTSLSLLVELHKWIQNFIVHDKDDFQMTTKESVQASYFAKFPKYFYFNLHQRQNRVKETLATIMSQLPTQLKINALKYQNDDIQSLLSQYRQKNIQTVLIIDQINIFFSILRRIKYYEYTRKDTTNLVQFQMGIQEILEMVKRIRVIYGSSENAEIHLIEQRAFNFSQNSLYIDKKKIKPGQGCSIDYTQQILSTIQFQNINQLIRLCKKDHLIQIAQRRKEYQRIYIMIKEKKFTYLPKYIGELTHERIKQYFLNNNQYLTSILTNENEDISKFYQMTGKMYDFTINQLSKRYHYFIFRKDQDSNTEISKYRMLARIRMKAYSQWMLQLQNNSYRSQFNYEFPNNLRQEQYGLLFKEHAEIEGKKFMIYLSPQSFLQVTDFMDFHEDYGMQIIKDIAKDNKDQPDWLGKTLQTNLINIIYQQNVNVNAKNYSFRLHSSHQMSRPTFVQFLGMITDQEERDYSLNNKVQIDSTNEVLPRFNQLIKEIDQMINQQKFNNNFYICAKPCTRQAGKYKIDPYSSSNSQTIDFLLIRSGGNYKVEQSQTLHKTYQIVSFDMCVSFTPGYINRKIKKAELFIEKFMHIAKKESDIQFKSKAKLKSKKNDPLQMQQIYQIKKITHIIILPCVMINKLGLKPRQTPQGQIPKSFLVDYVSLENFQIIFKNKQDELNMKNRLNFRQALLQIVKERSSKQQQQN